METNNFLFDIQKLCVLEEKLYDIINTLNECDTIASDINNTPISFSIIKKDCESQLKKVQNLHMNFFHSMCKHEFVDDYIDIGPETSRKITYCKNCGYTK